MIADVPGGTKIVLFIQPKSSKNEIVGPHNGALKIRVAAPPIEGRANEELIEFLAKALKLPKRSVEILKGDTGRNKTVHVAGLSAAEVKARLGL